MPSATSASFHGRAAGWASGSSTSSTPSGADPSAEVPNGSPPEPVEGAAPASDVADACAYDPAQAQAALDAGEPPTRSG